MVVVAVVVVVVTSTEVAHTSVGRIVWADQRGGLLRKMVVVVVINVGTMIVMMTIKIMMVVVVVIDVGVCGGHFRLICSNASEQIDYYVCAN